MQRTLAVVCGAAILVALGGTGGAVGARLIGSSQIADNSLQSIDVKDGDLAPEDLQPGIRETLSTAVTGYEVEWRRVLVTDSHTRFRINCPDGKVALGSGYHVPKDQAIVSGTFPVMPEEVSRITTGWEWWIDLTHPDVLETDAWLYVTCAHG